MTDPRAVQRRERRFLWLVEQCRDSRRVLDLGCGPASLGIMLAQRGIVYSGVDSDAAEIEKARRAVEAEPESVRARIELRVGTIEIVRPEERFDTIVLAEVLEHQREPARLLGAASAHLEVGGKLVVTTPFGWMPDPDHQWAPFASDLLAWLQTAGFGVRALGIGDYHLRCVAELGVAHAVEVAAVLRETERATEEVQRFWIGERDALAARVEMLIARTEELTQQNDELRRRIVEMRKSLTFRIANRVKRTLGLPERGAGRS